MPFPREDTTPPVTKTNLVMSSSGLLMSREEEREIIVGLWYIADDDTVEK
jgi:hypothetical protein